MFASMILQIPVENGHTGGRFKVQDEDSTLVFDCEKESSTKCHLSVIRNGSHQELETVTSGWVVMLSFNLVWKNAMTMADTALPLPSLLTTLNEIAESLRPWTEPRPSPEEIIVLDTPSDNPLVSETSNMLFFLLENKYSIADLGFGDLTGQDQLLARLFNCSQFLDVHLAVITQQVTGVPDYCDLDEGFSRTFKIEHWINSTNVLIKLKGIGLDYRTQLMGNIQKLRNYILPEEEEEEEEETSLRHHPVLVIWPKPQTIRIYCQYGFNAVLDRMEAAVDSQISPNQELIEDLGIVISFCRAEPLKVFRDPSTKVGQRTFRLFRLCLFLRASRQGLELLDLLAIDFNSSSSFEGIRSEQVARVIAEFQQLICGKSKSVCLLFKIRINSFSRN